jgi:uncharacterized repeat protein (TIGR03803 family)
MTTSRILEFFSCASARGWKRSRTGKLGAWKICALLLLCAATAVVAPAQTFTTLVSFDGANGANPYAPLVQGTDGNFFGTTSKGGVYGNGTVFRLTPGGTLTSLYSFCGQTNCPDGSAPMAGLVLGVDGNFYGTTAGGGSYGSGTVFTISSAGNLTTLYSFCAQLFCYDGSIPNALIQASDGNLYGTAQTGGAGAWGEWGTAFRITPGGSFTRLYSFCSNLVWNRGWWCLDDGDPQGALMQGTDGNLYGTTAGITGNVAMNTGGSVFMMTLEGTLTTLLRMGGWLGSFPETGLAQGTDGNLYGTTAGGRGISYYGPYGTVFQMPPGGNLLYFRNLYEFCGQANCADGSTPNALIQATDRSFYGTTVYGGVAGGCGGAGCGTIFKIATDGTLMTLHSFCPSVNCPDGNDPEAALVQATDGNFYGTTSGGGADSDGTVFRLSMGLPPFVSFIRNSGAVGATAQILGQGFTGTSSVSFDGIPTSFTVESDTYLTATVPAGATTAPVIVTTPSGKLKSNQLFRVTPQIFSFSPPSGPVGTSVIITGESFTGANDVLIGCDSDQTPMSFTVDSDTQITAIVPAGAVSGKIGVRTRGGNVSSATGFGVTN